MCIFAKRYLWERMFILVSKYLDPASSKPSLLQRGAHRQRTGCVAFTVKITIQDVVPFNLSLVAPEIFLEIPLTDPPTVSSATGTSTIALILPRETWSREE